MKDGDYQQRLIDGDFLPLSHQLVLHTTWVDGSVGRPLSTPTAQFAPPHFGPMPCLFAASPSQICLFLVAFSMQISGMSHGKIKTARPCWSRSPSVRNNGQLNIIKQSTLILAKKDNLDHVLLNCLYPAAIKKKKQDTVFSCPSRQIPLFYWLESRQKAAEYKTPCKARSCKGLKTIKWITHCPLTSRTVTTNGKCFLGISICVIVTFCSIRSRSMSNLQKTNF